jgi:hypothetical protein
MSAPTTVEDIEAWLGSTLPAEYRQFLNSCTVDSHPSTRVVLYGTSAFIERNETYETKDYCPGFVAIGNDSGDMELVMALEDAAIYLVDGGSMQMDTAEPLLERFSTWLSKNCPIPHFGHSDCEWPVDPLTPVCIYLERRPFSLSNLLAIKQRLGIDISIADLKRSAVQVPCRVADGMTYAAAKVRCRHANELDPCVGIRLAADETKRLPLYSEA